MAEKTQQIGVRVIKPSEPIMKADAPVQIDADAKKYASDWIEPAYDLEGLGQIVDNSNILPQCISAYKNNIAGYGIEIRYRADDQEETAETEAEWNNLEDIINMLTLEQDTKELFEDAIEARERYGIAYIEVIRDNAGNVTQLEFLKETPSIRMSRQLDPYIDATYYYKEREVKRKKRFRKFKQTIGGTTIYFKEFGDPRKMDLRSGKYSDNVPKSFRANELFVLSIGTENYGKVRWIGQILGSDGARRAEQLNNNYFINGRHCPLAIAVKNGSLTKESVDKLQQYMDGIRGSAGQHAFLLLEVEGIDNGFDGKPAEVEFKDLAGILQKDELFQEYIENNRQRIQSAFNLPDLYVGYTRDFNRATAQTAMEVTEKQVFQPERASLAWAINNRLLNGYNLKYCEVYFKEPEITNPDDLYKILTVAEKAGGLPPNKAKQVAYEALGEVSDDYEADWGDIPVTIMNLLNAQEQRQAQAEQLQAAREAQQRMNFESNKRDTAEDPMVEMQLDEQIEKAEQAGDPDELISVMKSVRSLLAEIRKQGDAE